MIKKIGFVLLMLIITLGLLAGCTPKKDRTTRFDQKDPKATVDKSVEIDQKTEEEQKPPMNTAKNTGETAKNTTIEITSFTGDRVEISKGYYVTEGKAPEGTQHIMINDYRLSKFKPGDSTWSYITATSINNLLPGENQYTVKALDGNGQVIASRDFTLVYQAQMANNLPDVGGSLGLPLSLSLILSSLWFAMKYIYTLRRQEF